MFLHWQGNVRFTSDWLLSVLSKLLISNESTNYNQVPEKLTIYVLRTSDERIEFHRGIRVGQLYSSKDSARSY